MQPSYCRAQQKRVLFYEQQQQVDEPTQNRLVYSPHTHGFMYSCYEDVTCLKLYSIPNGSLASQRCDAISGRHYETMRDRRHDKRVGLHKLRKAKSRCARFDRRSRTRVPTIPTDETWGAILISSDQLFAGNENQVRETLRLVEEVTYDLTSQSVPRPDPVRFYP